MGNQASTPRSDSSPTRNTTTSTAAHDDRPAGALGGGGGLPVGPADQGSIGRDAQKILCNAFLYSEARLSEVLDVARIDLRYLRQRHLVDGQHFRKNHGEILLSREAVSKLLGLLGLPQGSFPFDLDALLPIQKKPGEKNGPLMMEISNIPFNPRMVLARFEGDEEEHLVEVGKNQTFAKGDFIEVGEHDVQKGLYELRSAIPRDRRRPR